MELFDKDGIYVGEIFDSIKEKTEDAFEGSWIGGIIFLLIVAPWWSLLGIIIFLFIKLIKVLFKVVWWVISLPFYLIFKGSIPNFK